MMTHERFLALLDAHGSDLTVWPPSERGTAERLLASSPDAMLAWSAARDVELLLAVPPEVDPARVGRLVAAVARQAREAPRETVLLLLFGRMPARVAGALCVGLLALGWLAGGTLLPHPVAGGDVALLSDDGPALFEGVPR